jgi:hypothetical protein
MPKTAAQKAALRKKLAAVLRLPEYDAAFSSVKEDRGEALWSLAAGPWTLPVTVTAGRAGGEPALTMGDAGRAAPMPLPIIQKGTHYAIDTLGAGTAGAAPMSIMAIDATGQRYTGIRVAQVLAAARAIVRREKTPRVHLISDGWNASFICLLAAAIDPGLFATYTTYGSFPTLRYLMDWGMNYEHAPSFFCFGLMEVADVPQIRALMEGVVYRQPGRSVIADRR